MITQAIITLVCSVVGLIISFFPAIHFPIVMEENILGYSMFFKHISYFFPLATFLKLFNYYVLFKIAELLWSFIMKLYGLFPFVGR